MNDIYVQIKNLDHNPVKAIKLIGENLNYELSLEKIYNTIFATGYDINKNNINLVLSDPDWQITIAYGINLCLLYPQHPVNLFLFYFLYRECDIDMSEITYKFVSGEKDIPDIIEILNIALKNVIQHQDPLVKYYTFRSIVDFVSTIVMFLLHYKMSDKNIEEELKKKMI